MLAVMHKKYADYDVPHKHISKPVCSCLDYFALKLVYHSTDFKFFVLYELLCVELFKSAVIFPASALLGTWDLSVILMNGLRTGRPYKGDPSFDSFQNALGTSWRPIQWTLWSLISG